MASYWQQRLQNKAWQNFTGRSQELEFFNTLLTTVDPEYLLIHLFGVGGVGKTTLLDRVESSGKKNNIAVGRVNEAQKNIPDILAKFYQDLTDQGEKLGNFSQTYGSYQHLRQELLEDPKFKMAMLENSGRVYSAQSPQNNSQPTVFICYSQKDEEEKDLLLSHLQVIQGSGLIDLWSDDQIQGGTDWQEAIAGAIARARVAVFLITVNSLTSDLILNQEIPLLLQRRETEGLTIIPVIGKACPWKNVDWIAQMQVRPKHGRPVWSDGGSRANEELAAIAEEVARIIQKENEGTQAAGRALNLAKESSFRSKKLQIDDSYPEVIEDNAQFSEYLYQTVEDPQSRELLLNSNRILTQTFVQDISRITPHKRILLIFDTWEFLSTFTDEWLRVEFLADENLAKMGQNITLAMAGREQLAEMWRPYLGIIKQVNLEPFSPEEASTFLLNRGITDPPTVQALQEMSGNLPLMLALLSTGTTTKIDELSVTQSVVDSFLKWIPHYESVKREAIILCAFPRFFDEGVIAYLVPSIDAKELFAWLSSFSFTSGQTGYWRYHSIVRRLMIQHRFDQNKDQHRELHQRLVNYYDMRLAELTLPEDEKHNYQQWQNLELEWLYHNLCQNQGFDIFIKLFLQSFRLSTYAQKLVDTFMEAQEDSREKGDLYQWYELFQQVPNCRNKLDSSLLAWIPLFERLSRYESLTDPFLKAFVNYQLGHYYRNEQRYKLAETHYKQAIALQADYVSPRNTLGLLYELTERFTEAEALYRQCIQMEPGYVFPYRHLGRLLQKLERYEEAETFYKQAIQLSQNSPLVYINYGDFLQSLERYPEAEQTYRQALEFDPLSTEVYSKLGIVLEKAGHVQRAEEMYRQALALNPNDYMAHFRLGVIQNRTGRPDEAIASFRRCLEIDDKKINPYLPLANLLKELGRKQDALDMYQQASYLLPKNPTLKYVVAELYETLGLYQEALTWFEAYATLAPDDVDINKRIAQLKTHGTKGQSSESG
ncbi:MAG: tetratricopeptide repeat protein [Anaerolineae bacterium]|nr:tetratricopeptide repeat protein [Anaerolineae bacterium]